MSNARNRCTAITLLALVAGCAHPVPVHDDATLVYPARTLKAGERWHLPPAPSVSLDKPEERLIDAALATFPTGLSRDQVRWTAKVLVAESRKNQLDPFLVLGLIRVESSGWNYARSECDARGLMQIRPFVGEELARESHVTWQGADSLFDPAVNLRLGTHYLAQLQTQFGTLDRALAAYNMGPSRLQELLDRGKLPADYATKILWFAERYRAIATQDGDVMPGLARVAVDLASLEVTIDGKPSRALARAKAGSRDPYKAKLVELNGATTADLLLIVPGMTHKAADRIVGFRMAHGRFSSMEDLDRVRGLDHALIERIRDIAWVSHDVATPPTIVASN